MVVSKSRLYRSLITMIEWTMQEQENYQYQKDYFLEKWMREIATIKFHVSRGSGHTEFAVKLLTEYFKNAAIILPHSSFKNHHFFKNLDCKFKNRVVTPQFLNKLLGTKTDAVIIDCASLLSQEDVETIYSFFGPFVNCDRKFLFIFLE